MSNQDILPDLQSSLICDDVRQERNGKFMLIGIFDALALPKFPAGIQRVCIVNRWCCGIGRFQQRSRILNATQQPIAASKTVEIQLPDETASATCVEVFMNLKIERPGTYWIEILLENQLKLRYPLRVAQIQPSPHGSSNPPAPPESPNA